MGNINGNGLLVALNDGANNRGGEIEFRTDNGSKCPTVNDNPRKFNDFSRSGAKVPDDSGNLGQFQADAAADIAKTIVRIDDPSGGFTDLYTIDESTPGSGFQKGYGIGAAVTVFPGFMDLGTAGVARAIEEGLQSYKYQLRDGSGNPISGATIVPSDGAHVPIRAGGSSSQIFFQVNQTLTFTNGTASEFNVERIDVRDNGNNALLFQATNFSATVPQNGKLNFTTLKMQLTLP